MRGWGSPCAIVSNSQHDVYNSEYVLIDEFGSYDRHAI
jgi:hypothetical protein